MYIADASESEMADQIAAHALGKTSVLLVGEHSTVNIESLIRELCDRNLDFIGAVFPKIIHDNTIHDTGIVQNTFARAEHVFLVDKLNTGDYELPHIKLEPTGKYTLLTYVDGLTPRKSEFLVSLYNRFGAGVKYLGGGAGSLSLEQRPCVFTRDGIFQDAAVCCLLHKDVALAVRHGWEKIAGPLIATRTDGNVIEELNWQNAFEVYKAIVEEHSGRSFAESDFFDIAKGFPFGIVREHTERVVRDPLMVGDNGEIICVGEVDENTFLDILEGKTESLVAAAESAVRDCLDQTENPRKAIIIDCISRVLFMESDFQKELDGVIRPMKEKNPQISVGGALTLGEISSFGDGLIQFFNKTVVIGLF